MGGPAVGVRRGRGHCVTQWGHDFRPDYLRLGDAIRALRPRSVLALTATATAAVRGHLIRRLAMRNPSVFLAPLDREDLRLAVRRVDERDKPGVVLECLARRRALPALVYVGRRADASLVAEFLAHEGLVAEAYHAGLSPEHRREIQDRFLEGRTPVVAATVAFGMGIDKPDVRTVLHWQHPPSLENYFQEAGRAGRDGHPSLCLLLHSERDLMFRRRLACRRYPEREELDSLHAALGRHSPKELVPRFQDWDPDRWRMSLAALLGHGHDPARRPARRASPDDAWDYLERLRRAEQGRLDEMERYLGASSCRRRILLGYFGEDTSPCANCDRCRTRRGWPWGGAVPGGVPG